MCEQVSELGTHVILMPSLPPLTLSGLGSDMLVFMCSQFHCTPRLVCPTELRGIGANNKFPLSVSLILTHKLRLLSNEPKF